MEPKRSPIGWALLPLKRYADFSGRATRAEFWWFMLFVVILYVVLSFVFVGSISGLASSGTDPTAAMLGMFGAAGIFMVLFWLAILIPTLAVQTRRLHDTGRSGWWLVGFYALYVVYMLLVLVTGFSEDTANPDQSLGVVAGAMIVALGFLIYSVVLLVFYCLSGTKGANRYGPDPYGEDVEKVFA